MKKALHIALLLFVFLLETTLATSADTSTAASKNRPSALDVDPMLQRRDLSQNTLIQNTLQLSETLETLEFLT
jgi:hypothetical protein